MANISCVPFHFEKRFTDSGIIKEFKKKKTLNPSFMSGRGVDVSKTLLWRKFMNTDIFETLPMILIGIALIIWSIVSLLKRIGMQEVTATRVDTKERHLSDNVVHSYKNTYCYVFNGVKYVSEESNYFGSKPTKRNKVCKIYVDPDDPERIFTTGQVMYYVLFIIGGIVLIVASLFLW